VDGVTGVIQRSADMCLYVSDFKRDVEWQLEKKKESFRV